MPSASGPKSFRDLNPDEVAALSRGEMESRNLIDCLAIDINLLLATVLGDTQPQSRIDPELGYTKRFAEAAQILYSKMGEGAYGLTLNHPSDTVRGWAAYIASYLPDRSLAERIEMVRPLAADLHFGVREWAWIGIRNAICAEPLIALEILAPWSQSDDPNIRRFASEATRPRGVWCAHISLLKIDPTPGLTVLEPLRADSAKYVQLSVGNWLNDASKSHPEWVIEVCKTWNQESKSENTIKITTRALRSLNKAISRGS